jgi:hypothetical protein
MAKPEVAIDRKNGLCYETKKANQGRILNEGANLWREWPGFSSEKAIG